MLARSVIALACGVCLGCSSGPSEREQAGALLEQLLRVDVSAPASERSKELAALDALPLTVPELLEVRTLCSGVHSSLLQAEAKQLAARNALDEAERAPRDGGIPPDVARSVADAIRQSESGLASAVAGLPACQSRLRELTVRYR